MTRAFTTRLLAASLSLGLLAGCGSKASQAPTYSSFHEQQESVGGGLFNALVAEGQAEVGASFEALDKDKDGFLAGKELGEDATTALKGYDKDGDGKLSKDEAQAYVAAAAKDLLASGEQQAVAPQPPMNLPAAALLGDSLPFNPQPQINKVTAMIDAGEIYPEVLAGLDAAQTSILMDLFLLGGKIGEAMADRLIAKHKAGLDVRVIVDPNLGMAGTAKAQMTVTIRRLLDEGVRIRYYPLRKLPRADFWGANKFQIDHQKVIVVDKAFAYLGSMNFIDSAEPNHDLTFRLDGPAAAELGAMVDAEWGIADPRPKIKAFMPGFSLLSLVPRATTRSAQDGLIRLTKTDFDQVTTKPLLLAAIAQAQASIAIEMFEFSDPDITDALIQAHNRGVRVRVILDAKDQAKKYIKAPIPSGMPNLWPARQFRDAGLPVRWYKPQRDDELHMKVAIIDNRTVFGGSTNFTSQAFKYFRETGMELTSPAIAGQLMTMFEADWNGKTRLVREPSFWERVVIRMIKWMDRHQTGWW